MDKAHRALAIARIGVEFGGIDIDQIGNHPALEISRHILPHLAGKDEDRADPPARQRGAHIIRQRLVMKGRQADRLPLGQGLQPGQRQGFLRARRQ
jgi:hypothetical protein